VNGDLDLSICAIIHDVHRLCCRLALCLCFAAGVCTIGKLSQRAAPTGREGHDCANSDDSWLHIDIIHKHGRRDQAVKWGAFSCDSVCCVTRRKKLYVIENLSTS
jgi:hypothetical protein